MSVKICGPIKNNNLLKLNDLKKYLIHEVSESELIRLLHEISRDFTVSRQNIGAYIESPKKVTAYSLFYLPTNYPKFSFVMDRLSIGIQKAIANSFFIDCGAGPGTYSLAFINWVGNWPPKDMTSPIALYDKSNLMLKQAREFVSKMANHKKFMASSNIKDIKMYVDREGAELQKTLFFGNSYNEMADHDFDKLFHIFAPDFLIFIEPGTRESFKRLSLLRIKLQERGYNILYPCPSSKINCPIFKNLMIKNETRVDDWCHQILKTTHESQIERLSQILKLDRRHMPLCSFVYSKEKSINTNTHNQDRVVNRIEGRVVRLLRETKFSFELVVCGNDVNHDLLEVEIMKKDMDKKMIKMISNDSVGLYYQGAELKRLGPSKMRATLDQIK